MVNYRSTALAETAPELVSSVESRDVSRIPAILAANQAAERVREEFKKKGRARRSNGRSKNGDGGPLDEEADKAGRYDRRLKMNRESAAASRVRREAYIKALEQQLLLEHEKYGSLLAEFDAERSAHNKLRTDVQNAKLLVEPTVPEPTPAAVNQPASVEAEQPVPAQQPPATSELSEVKQEDLLSELANFPPPEAVDVNSLLFGPGLDPDTLPLLDSGVPALPPHEAHAYSANVATLFADLGLPLTQIPDQVADDMDPVDISENMNVLMDFQTE